MKTSGNTILLTGGGSGIGREMARRWHAMGNTVIITGRRLNTLNETIGDRQGMFAYALDVADPAAIAAFAAEVVRDHPAINVLVNNAGIMVVEDIGASRDLSDAEAMITTNLTGPIRLIDAMVDHLKSVEDAAIVNVTSGLAFVPMPRASTYSATKAAMHSYTLSLRHTLDGQVEVIELIPPAVQTELTPGQSTREGYMPLADFIDETMAQFESGAPGPEVCTTRVLFLRDAEAQGRFDDAFAVTSSF